MPPMFMEDSGIRQPLQTQIRVDTKEGTYSTLNGSVEGWGRRGGDSN